MSASQMLAALKAAEPVIAEFERIINKRITWGDPIKIKELEQVRSAIKAHERMCLDQGCLYFGTESPKSCNCHKDQK